MVAILQQAVPFAEAKAVVPAAVLAPMRPHLCGGHAALHRYTNATEKPGIALGPYNPAQDVTYNWPGLDVGGVVDLSYVRIYIDYAYLQYFQNLIGGADTIAPVASFKNRFRFSATNLQTANGYNRAAAFGDRDVQVGDSVFVQGNGDSLWSTVSALVADATAATVASAVADPSNVGSQSASTSAAQTGGATNYLNLTASGTNYDGSATGDISDVYTLTVTTGSVGGDATTAVLAVTTSSGRDNVASLTPAAFGTAFAVGTRGLTVTFTNTNTNQTIAPNGTPPTDFVLGQVFQATVAQNWTPAAATSGGSYAGTSANAYFVRVTRGGLYQTPLPIAAPTIAPTVNVSGGGATGGVLQAGTYYARYTWVNSAGETTPGPESAQFTIVAGYKPLLTFPALPSGVTSLSLYLTPTNGASGTEIRYATGITGTTYTLTGAVATEPPLTSNAVGFLAAPTVVPTVNPTGGSPTGGALQAGTYYLKYTFTQSGGETAASPESAQFTVAAGNQPLVTLPALPTGATGISLYLTPTNGASGQEIIRYATGIVATTYTMAAAAVGLPPSVNSTAPSASNPAFTPTVTPAGGGSSGGYLPAGTYYLKVTYNGTAGETLASTESALFTVAAGDIPEITNVPTSAPSNAVTFNVYLTPANGASGSEFLYASAVSFPGGGTYDLVTAPATTAPAPPGANTTNPVVANATTAPTVVAAGGGSVGGQLPAGAYYCRYTWTNHAGETEPSTESAPFTVVAGDIPQVTIPVLPANALGATIYLTPTAGGSDSEIRYVQKVTTTTYNLQAALPIGLPPPTDGATSFTPSNASTAPTVNVTGGGSTGGHLPAGSYYIKYTWLGDISGETLVSSESTQFTIAAGNIPQVTVPALPSGVGGVKVYITQPGGAAGSETNLPSTDGATGPTINLNASAGSALVLPPPTTTTATAVGANPAPPQITAVTTLGIDGSGPTNVTAAATPVAAGALGVTIRFSGSGLCKDDLYSIQVSPAGSGPVRTIVLNNNLSTLLQAATTLSVSLYIQKQSDFMVPAPRLSSPPLVNWSATVNGLVLKAGMTATDPSLTNGGVPVYVPVISGPGTTVYAHYRDWLPTYAQQVNSIVDPTTLQTVFGYTPEGSYSIAVGASVPIPDPDTVLPYAIYKALQNANGSAVWFSSPGDPSVLANWQAILQILEGLKYIYSLVPLSVDPNVLAAYQAHIDARSADDDGEWRAGWFQLVPQLTFPVVAAPVAPATTPVATTSDGLPAQGLVSANPLVAGTYYTYVTCSTHNGRFVTNGVQPGDVLRILFSQDAFGDVTYASYPIQQVVNEDTLVLAQGPNAPIATVQRLEVWRNPSPTQVAAALAASIVATTDERIRFVWPDSLQDGGVSVAGFNLCASLAALAGAVAPQQGLATMQVVGYDVPVLESTSYFNNAQLQTLAAAGAVIVSSDVISDEVYVVAAKTAAQGTDGAAPALAASLEQMARNNDALRYLFYGTVSPFFGKANITPTLLALIQADVTSGIQTAKQVSIDRVGPLLVDASITILRQSILDASLVQLQLSTTISTQAVDATVTLLF